MHHMQGLEACQRGFQMVPLQHDVFKGELIIVMCKSCTLEPCQSSACVSCKLAAVQMCRYSSGTIMRGMKLGCCLTCRYAVLTDERKLAGLALGWG